MIIETPRLRLREFGNRDWAAVLHYQTDPLYLRYYRWTQRTEEDVRAFVGQFLEWQATVPRYRFQLAVTLRDGGRLIGNCGIRQPQAGLLAAEVGFEIAPEHWGCGYATEAARAMVGFGFDELGLRRVWGECVAENSGAQRVLVKLGMRRVAQLRKAQWYKGRWWDRLVYSVLDVEWRSVAGGGVTRHGAEQAAWRRTAS